jgi:hypothetical protein
MAFETLTKRILYEMRCECGHTETVDDNPPREKQCPYCKKWNKFEKLEWTGQDKFGGK